MLQLLEITWIVSLLSDLHVTNLKPFNLNCHNQSTIHIVKNLLFFERTKHIELDCHFTWETVLESLIELTYKPTDQQLEDVFPKALFYPQDNFLLSKLGIY